MASLPAIAAAFTSNAGRVPIMTQGTPTALTTDGDVDWRSVADWHLLTANQGGAGAAAYKLPTGTDMQAALPTSFGVNNAFDFSIANISTVTAESVSVTTNTGFAVVGNMGVMANDGTAEVSAGRFRARETAANTFTLYRIG